MLFIIWQKKKISKILTQIRRSKSWIIIPALNFPLWQDWNLSEIFFKKILFETFSLKVFFFRLPVSLKRNFQLKLASLWHIVGWRAEEKKMFYLICKKLYWQHKTFRTFVLFSWRKFSLVSLDAGGNIFRKLLISVHGFEASLKTLSWYRHAEVFQVSKLPLRERKDKIESSLMTTKLGEPWFPSGSSWNFNMRSHKYFH